MADVLAIVSKLVFEKEARLEGTILGPGGLYKTDRYRSKNKGLSKLAGGGTLFLVTARAGDALWLVAVLENPKKDDDGWLAKTNRVPIRDVSSAISELRFSSGKGIKAATGRLGMALQAPRELTAADVALLRGRAPTATKPRAAKAAPRSNAKRVARPARAKAARPPKEKRTPTRKSATEQVTNVSSLAELLARWQVTRAPVLAEAIARVGRATESSEARELRGRAKIPQEDWLANLDSISVADRGALLASLTDTTSAKVKDRVAALDAWAGDPRVCDALHEVIRTIPWTSTATRTVWVQIFKQLLAFGDPRTIAVARGFEPAAISSSWSGPAEWMGSRLAKLADKIEALGEGEPLSADERAAYISAARGAPAQSGAQGAGELLAHVFANPADDEARLVLSDALMMKGDPRGEYIAVQHRNASGQADRASLRREKELLKANEAEWLGPLARWSLKRGRSFRLGFVDSCQLKEKVHGGGIAELTSCKHLATIRKLEASPAVLALPNLSGLREAHVAPEWKNQALDEFLRADRVLPLEHLRARIEPGQVLLFEDNPALANLVTLGVIGEAATVASLLQTSVGRQLETLYLGSGYYSSQWRGELQGVLAVAASSGLRQVGAIGIGHERDWSIELLFERGEGSMTKLACNVTLKGTVPGYAGGFVREFLGSVGDRVREIVVRSPVPLRENVRLELEQLLLTHAPRAALTI